jgi:hypothetical protein
MKENGEHKVDVNVKKAEESSMVKLIKPLKLADGRVFEELDVDVDKLTMGDLHNLEMEYAAVFPTATPTNGIFMTDAKYHALLVARINGIIYDNMKNLGARDTFNLSNRIGRFLVLPA